MANRQYVCKTGFGNFEFMKQPTKIESFTELPNWMMKTYSKTTQLEQPLYMAITQNAEFKASWTEFTRNPDAVMGGYSSQVYRYLMGHIDTPEFKQAIGYYDPIFDLEAPPNVDAERLFRFYLNKFHSRQRLVKNNIISGSGGTDRPNWVRLIMARDVTFEASVLDEERLRYGRDIVGQAVILGKEQIFRIRHPYLGLVKIMDPEAAMYEVAQVLVTQFPFLKIADAIKNVKYL
jgi:hypothetical protein